MYFKGEYCTDLTDSYSLTAQENKCDNSHSSDVIKLAHR